MNRKSFNVKYFCVVVCSVLILIFSLKGFKSDTRANMASSSFVKFKPISFNDRASKASEMYIVQSKIPDGFYKSLRFVLSYYSVAFKDIDSIVYVSSESWNDQDYMANMSAKAQDGKWLLEHGFKDN